MIAEKEISFWVKALLQLFEGKTETEKESIFKRLVAILKKRKKEYLLPKIVKKLEKIFLKRNRAEVFFARKHSPEIIRKTKNKLFEKFGKDKKVEIKIEKDLIGGFRIKTSNVLIKASVKDFLEELKTVIKY